MSHRTPRQEFYSDGSSASSTSWATRFVIWLQSSSWDSGMPDYRTVGLIETIRDTYRGSDSDE